MSAILTTKNLSFSYSGKSLALDDVSITIPKGKKIVLLGPNGAGKSTLFLHFNGVNEPDEGEVFFDGKPLDYGAASLAKLRADVALVFQNPDDQIFSATVEEDIAFGPLNLGLQADEVSRRVDEALSWVGLTELRERPTQQLSFGQRKRVALAGALAMKPKVLIMDEPTAGLDAEMVHELLELSDELNHRGLTFVMSTHDVETAYEWADEVRALHKGKLVFSGKPEEFFSEEELLHKLGLMPPLAFLTNQQLHWRTGKSEKPYPRSFVEMAEKCFPLNRKAGTVFLACVDDRTFIPAKHAGKIGPAHLHSGVYGTTARRLAEEGKLDVHFRFHALEHGLLQASLGHDFVLYTDTSLCSLVEARAKRLEERTGLKVNISHTHTLK